MATPQEVLDALDRRLLATIPDGMPQTILELAEARAWLSDPAQDHGRRATPA